MKKLFHYSLLSASIFFTACSSTKNTVATNNNGKIDITFVQINDVYEIAPLEGGKVGGMARVATIKNNYLQNNPNTFLVMAGDFLSPSVYNSLKYDGSRIRGKQMIDAMNTAGVDLAVFGNHEFDITETELQSRINESTFKWVSTNTFQKKVNAVAPFVKYNAAGTEPLAETYILQVKDKDGTTAKIGFIGLTLPFNKAPYVSYTDVFTAAQLAYNKIKDSCDAVVAVTHQAINDDIKLARQIPELALIIGGHEHVRHYTKIGKVYITKADANARSVYIIKLTINKINKQLKLKTSLIDINESIAMDAATDVVVKKWTEIADKNYASIGFDARKIVIETGEPLDGRESYVRTGTTNLTRLIIAAMEKASPAADVAITNSGSIRVDDILQPPVTQYDIIRSLPFGGSIVEVDMKGSLLIKILNAGVKNVGIGGFLQYSPSLVKDIITGNWSLKNIPVDANKVYKIATSDFLMTGGEANLDFMNEKNSDVVKMYPVFTDLKDPRSDIRRAIFMYLEERIK